LCTLAQIAEKFLVPRQGRRNRIDRPLAVSGVSHLLTVQAAALLTQGRATWAGSMWEGYGAPESGWMMSLVQVHRRSLSRLKLARTNPCVASTSSGGERRWGWCAGPPCTVLGLGLRFRCLSKHCGGSSRPKTAQQGHQIEHLRFLVVLGPCIPTAILEVP
jgi:hypothetical protein